MHLTEAQEPQYVFWLLFICPVWTFFLKLFYCSFTATGNLDDAIKVFTEALQINPKSAPIFFKRAR